MSDTVLLTGATGFLGMEVLARLLERRDTDVITLVRAADRAAAAERVDAVLAQMFERRPFAAPRITALPADVAADRLGMSESDRREVLERVTSVIHCAASIAFDLPIEDALDVNAGGALRVLELARELAWRGRLRRFVHVSTAYVCGRHQGLFAEGDLNVCQTFRNTYEQSKYQGEELLGDADELPLVIARPSIVVGDSRSGWTPAFNVIYWPLRAFSRGLLDRVPADPAGIVDIVPVDYVADGILALLDSDRVRGTVHLVAGNEAVTNQRLIDVASRTFGCRPPLLQSGGAAPIDQAEVYLPYFDVRARFDDRRAREHLGPGLLPPRFEDYFPTIIDYALHTRWGKNPLKREAAIRRSADADAERAA